MNNPGSWVVTDDYPSAAIRNEESGRTGFTLEIDADGKVANCIVTSSSGSALLDSTACKKISARAIFQPALDPIGNPVASTYSSRVRWELPDYRIPMPLSGVEIKSMRVDAEGYVTQCRERDMREKANPWKPCSVYMEQFVPHRDKDGNAVPVRIIVSTSYNVVEVDDDE